MSQVRAAAIHSPIEWTTSPIPRTARSPECSNSVSNPDPTKEIELMTKTIVRGLAAVTCFAAVGCASLDIANPNEPNNKSALADPTAIESVAAGAHRHPFNADPHHRGRRGPAERAQSFSC